MRKRVAIITNIIPTYREGFYGQVFAEEQKDYVITVFCQKDFPGNTIKSIHAKYGDRVQEISYFHLFGAKLIWQWLPITKLFLNYSIIVVDGNPRHLSQAILSTLFRIFGKKIVIWSVAHSWRDHSFSKNLRLHWWRIFNNFLMYTEKDLEELNRLGFGHKNIISINNGLNQQEILDASKPWNENLLTDWRASHGLVGRKIVLSCGRLLQGKYEVMVDALAELIKVEPTILWCVIGDGPARDQLEKAIKEKGLSQYARFIGAIYKQPELAPWFLSSLFFVHPTAIGLSILHAYGYGLPVITHNNASKHGSEFAVFENNRTGKSYDFNNPADLVKVMVYLLDNQQELNLMKENVSKIANEKHNVRIMKDRFFSMLKSIT